MDNLKVKMLWGHFNFQIVYSNESLRKTTRPHIRANYAPRKGFQRGRAPLAAGGIFDS